MIHSENQKIIRETQKPLIKIKLPIRKWAAVPGSPGTGRLPLRFVRAPVVRVSSVGPVPRLSGLSVALSAPFVRAVCGLVCLYLVPALVNDACFLSRQLQSPH